MHTYIYIYIYIYIYTYIYIYINLHQNYLWFFTNLKLNLGYFRSTNHSIDFACIWQLISIYYWFRRHTIISCGESIISFHVYLNIKIYFVFKLCKNLFLYFRFFLLWQSTSFNICNAQREFLNTVWHCQLRISGTRISRIPSVNHDSFSRCCFPSWRPSNATIFTSVSLSR